MVKRLQLTWVALFFSLALISPARGSAQELDAGRGSSLFSSEELQAANTLLRECKSGECQAKKKEVVAALLVRCIHSLSTYKEVDGKDLAALRALSPGLYAEFLSNIKDKGLRAMIERQVPPKPAAWVLSFSAAQLFKSYEATIAQLEKRDDPTSLAQLKMLQKKLQQPEMKRLEQSKVSALLSRAEQLITKAESLAVIEQPSTQPTSSPPEPPLNQPAEPPQPATQPAAELTVVASLEVPSGVGGSLGSFPIVSAREPKALSIVPVGPTKIYYAEPPMAVVTDDKGATRPSLRAPVVFLTSSVALGVGALGLYAVTQSTRVTNNAREYTRIGLELGAGASFVASGASLGFALNKSSQTKKNKER